MLIEGNPLPARWQDHPLRGDWKNHRDCYIEPDWLLLYKIDAARTSFRPVLVLIYKT